jgi:hypothetical protein
MKNYVTKNSNELVRSTNKTMKFFGYFHNAKLIHVLTVILAILYSFCMSTVRYEYVTYLESHMGLLA